MPVPRNAPVARYYIAASSRDGLLRYDLTDRCLEFDFDDHTKKHSKLSIRLNNWDLYHIDNPFWDKGTVLRVQWGYPGLMARPRQLTITNVKGSRELTVEAMSRLSLMNKLSKTRTFPNATPSKTVQEIAADHGFDGSAGRQVNLGRTEDQETESQPTIVQPGVTDLQQIARLAAIDGREVYEDADGLHYHRPNLQQAPVTSLTWYTPPGVRDIIDWHVENDIYARPGAVSVAGVNPMTGREETATASADDPGRAGLAPRVEAGAWRQTAASGQVERGTTLTKPDAVRSTGDAARKASGILAGAQLGQVKLTITCVGDPLLVVGRIVTVYGIGQKLSGNYYIRGARHKIVSGGQYTTVLRCVRDGVNRGGNPTGADDVNSQTANPNRDRLEKYSDRNAAGQVEWGYKRPNG